MGVILYPQPPFDFALSLRYLRRSDREIVDTVAEGRYRRLLEYAGSYYLVQAAAPGTPEEPCLEVSVLDDAASRETLAGLAGVIARMFNAYVDLHPFYRRVATDPVMSALTRRFYGLKPVLAASVFESLAWAIIGQQVNLQFAYTLKQNIVKAAGWRTTYGGETFYAFPTPRQLAGLTAADLTGMKFSGRKAEYLLDFAHRVDQGEIDLTGLTGKTPAEVIVALTAIRGIGQWTAEYCLLRGLGCPDALLAGDIGLRNAVTAYYRLPEQATETQVRDLGENWSGWRSYANFYLWQALTEDKRMEKG